MEEKVLADNDTISNDHEWYKIQLSKQSVYENMSEQEGFQTESEMSILSSEVFCSLGKMSHSESMKQIRKAKIRLDNSKFSEIGRTGFNDINAMKAQLCMSETFFLSKNAPSNTITRIRNWIRKVESSNNSNSNVLRADIDGDYDPFVLKYSTGEDNQLMHEYFVASQGTNKLRNYIPNFAFAFGMIRCSPPIINKENDGVDTWCTKKSDLPYLVYENVFPSKTMKELSGKMKPESFVNLYLQILYSLHLGNKELDFTHYDLHDTNVVVREIDCYMNIRYETENGEEYLRTNSIATIIDFGMSHIKKGEKHYGSWGYQQYFVSPEKSFPLYDAYKLLMFFSSRLDRKSKTFDICRMIFGFFNKTEDFEYSLEKQLKYYYSLPYTKIANSKSLLDLTSHVRKGALEMGYDMSFISKKTSEQICLSHPFKSVNAYIEYFTNGSPTNIFGMYDAIIDLQDSDKQEDVEQLILELMEEFDYDSSIEKFMIEFNKILDKIADIDIDRPDVESYNRRNITGNIKEFEKYFSQVVRYYDAYFEYRMSKKIGLFIAELYEDDETIEKITTESEEFENDFTDPVILLEETLSDIRKINRFAVGTEDKNKLNRMQNSLIVLLE